MFVVDGVDYGAVLLTVRLDVSWQLAAISSWAGLVLS
jgi:hypothetical protein